MNAVNIHSAMTSTKAPYHHGDLAAALLRSAMELVDEAGASGLSLRAVARRAGVSPGAPYRHYADREALISTVATLGYQELGVTLFGAHPEPESADELVDVAVAYVSFALRRPALFRIMFGEPCNETAERQAAVDAIQAYVRQIAVRLAPQTDPEAMGTALWALVHGLAFLHLDGKFDSDTDEQVRARVDGAVRAALTGLLGPAR